MRHASQGTTGFCSSHTRSSTTHFEPPRFALTREEPFPLRAACQTVPSIVDGRVIGKSQTAQGIRSPASHLASFIWGHRHPLPGTSVDSTIGSRGAGAEKQGFANHQTRVVQVNSSRTVRKLDRTLLPAVRPNEHHDCEIADQQGPLEAWRSQSEIGRAHV